MKIVNNDKFLDTDVYFTKRSTARIMRMNRDKPLYVMSTVCPDYPHKDGRYTFKGDLGEGISFTAWQHIKTMPKFIQALKDLGFTVRYRMLVADLTNACKGQEEFNKRVAGSREEYLRRCHMSSLAIEKELKKVLDVEIRSCTFTSYYLKHNIKYDDVQYKTMLNILKAKDREDFKGKFQKFMEERRPLSEKLWHAGMTQQEEDFATAHGMSLYTTHGTLLRHIYKDENFLLINHVTPNLKNFYLTEFVTGYEHVKDYKKFCLGLITGEFY